MQIKICCKIELYINNSKSDNVNYCWLIKKRITFVIAYKQIDA